MKNVFYFLLILMLVACGGNSTEEGSTDETISEAPMKVVPTLVKKWETDTVLTTSESLVFDPAMGVYYVSCIGGVPPGEKDGDGFIAKIDQRGQVIGEVKWITGMHAPKGLGLVGSDLYISDIDEVIVADVQTGQITKRIKIDGASFLNDIAIGPDNSVYVTDTDNNTIFKVEGEGSSVFLIDTLIGRVNGAWIDDESLMVIGFAAGELRKYNLGENTGMVVADSIFGGDGIEKMGDAFYVSSWNGEVYHIDADGVKTLVVDTKDQEVNAADIETVESQNLLLIPTFFANTVAAYEVTY